MKDYTPPAPHVLAYMREHLYDTLWKCYDGFITGMIEVDETRTIIKTTDGDLMHCDICNHVWKAKRIKEPCPECEKYLEESK